LSGLDLVPITTRFDTRYGRKLDLSTAIAAFCKQSAYDSQSCVGHPVLQAIIVLRLIRY